MKRKAEVHNGAVKVAMLLWVGLGPEGALQCPEWEKGNEGEGCRGSGERGCLHLEKGNCGHALISPACRGLFCRGGNRAGAGWAG